MTTNGFMTTWCLLGCTLLAAGCEVHVRTSRGGDPFGDDAAAGPARDAAADAAGWGDGGPDAGARWTLRDYCEASLTRRLAWSAWLDDCCQSGALGSAEGAQLAGLVGAREEDVQACVDGFQQLVDDGEVLFEPASAERCASAQDGGGLPPPPASCTGASLAELDVSGHAARPLKHLAACAATFAPRRSPGDPCHSSLACPEGHRCLASGAEGIRTCQRAVPEGGVCATTIECAAGLYCVGEAADGSRACRSALGGLGSKCSETRECEDGLFCRQGDDGAAGRCATPAGAGEDCASDFDCAVDLYCDAAGRCAPFAANGAACVEAHTCDGYCDLDGGVCRSLCGS